MKIGTLTFHTAHNYGAMLQAYALVQYIRSLGHDAEVIDYQAEFNLRRFAPKPIAHYLNIREIYNILFRNSYQKPCPEAFRNFYEHDLQKSTRRYSLSELKEAATKYDRIVAGSDQIWNLACTMGDDSYFLPFAPDEKKFAYAASFGVSEVPSKLRERISAYLRCFQGISVRECEAVDIVRDLTGREAKLVVDPTMLLTKDQWAEMADYTRCPTNDYLLVYVMSEDPKLLRFAEEYARRSKLKLLYITQRLFKRMRACFLRDVTPNQWIGLFLKANTIVTNSFHGAAFSINFGKNFYIRYIPRSIANSRLKTLVENYDLASHLIGDDKKEDTYIPLDLQAIKTQLEKRREASCHYITNTLLK